LNVDKYIFLGLKTDCIVITESLNCTYVSIDYMSVICITYLIFRKWYYIFLNPLKTWFQYDFNMKTFIRYRVTNNLALWLQLCLYNIIVNKLSLWIRKIRLGIRKHSLVEISIIFWLVIGEFSIHTYYILYINCILIVLMIKIQKTHNFASMKKISEKKIFLSSGILRNPNTETSL